MCIIVLGSPESVDRYWEWKLAAKEKRRNFFRNLLPHLVVGNKNQYEVLHRADNTEQNNLPGFKSETTLLLPK